MTLLQILTLLTGLLVESGLVLFFISALREQEPGAARKAVLLAGINPLIWAGLLLFGHLDFVRGVNLTVLLALFAFFLISLVRYFPPRPETDLSTIEQFDERDHMFSRNALQYHPDLLARYFELHPEREEIDRHLHGKPELGEPGGKFYDPLLTGMADAAFAFLDRQKKLVEGEKRPEKAVTDPLAVAAAIRFLAKYYGAVDVGFTALQPYHFYSHYGRRAEQWGEPVRSAHTHAVVILVAMDQQMLKYAPSAPVIMESARQYVEAAKIAHLIAHYLRGLGYSARAHVDGNYEVICPPLAQDAGLGEVSRMSILIHPVHGPAVRIAAVTTDLELPQSPRKPFYIEEFCSICKKCADNCPTFSIPRDEKPLSRGFAHWSIRQETCYSFWKGVGTDCALCIRSCPYTKPDTFIHRLVRFYISRNSWNQRIAIWLDDFFYGRKLPITSSNPDWFGKK